MIEKYEEYNVMAPVWGWVLLFAFSAVIVGFGLMAHALIPEVARTWDFGQFPIVPSVEPVSTFGPKSNLGFQRQLPPLPIVPVNVNEKPPVNTFNTEYYGR